MLGAMIGGAIAASLAVVVAMWKRQNKTSPFLLTLAAEGRRAARETLEREHPPVTQLARGNVDGVTERFAGLAQLGEVDLLWREMSVLDGPSELIAQTHAAGLLGLAVHGPDPITSAMRARLLASAVECDLRRTPRAASIVARTRAFADLATAVAGGATPVSTVVAHTPILRALVSEACGRLPATTRQAA